MESETFEIQKFKLEYKGKSLKLTGIMLVNLLLNFITLFIFTPWSLKRKGAYLRNSMVFEGHHFELNIKGINMMGSYLKLILILLWIPFVIWFFDFFDINYVSGIIVYFTILLVLPLLIFGSFKSSISRTQWNQVPLQFKGNRNEFVGKWIIWSFLYIITLGWYGCFLQNNIRSYLLNNVKFGDVELRYKGKSLDLFVLVLVGTFLSIITLGIYSVWFIRNYIHFAINNISFYKDGREINMRTNITIKETFIITITNLLIFVFTLGLGTPWIINRTLKKIIQSIELQGTLELHSIYEYKQEEDTENKSLIDQILDFNLIFF